MRIKSGFLLAGGLFLAVALTMNCGKGEGDKKSGNGRGPNNGNPNGGGGSAVGTLAIDISAETSRSAPSVVLASQNTASGASMPGTLQTGRRVACTDSVYNGTTYTVVEGNCVHGVVRGALRYECYYPGQSGVDFCPSAIPASAKLGDSFKFSETALLGAIFYAVSRNIPSLYPGSPAPTSIELDGYRWVSTSGLLNTPATDGDPTKYIIGMTGLYDAIRPGDYADNVQSTSSDGTLFAFVHARKHELVGSNDFVNRISQGYVTMATPTSSRIIALNAALAVKAASRGPGANGHRNIAIMNTTTHRFILKQRNYQTDMGDLVLYGSGGRAPDTGVPYAGYFYAKARQNAGGIWEACVDNETMLVVNASNCASLHDMFAEDHTALVSWLGLTESESTHLANFLDVFSSAAMLPDSAMPTPDDDWKNWPDTVEAN